MANCNLYCTRTFKGKQPFPASMAGFTYLTILFAVALMGVALAAAGTSWHIIKQRAKERELLFIGHQYRQAIASYYRKSPGMIKQYPPSIDQLLKDSRFLGLQRHLRRKYSDPMTNNNQWGIISAPDGGIMGVYSLSMDKPLKTNQFDVQDRAFENKAHYAEWKFIYIPPTSIPTPR